MRPRADTEVVILAKAGCTRMYWRAVYVSLLKMQTLIYRPCQSLFVAELWLALFAKRGHAFLLIFSCKKRVEDAAFKE